MKLRNLLVPLLVLGAGGLGFYLYEKHVNATTPVNTLQTGTAYKLTGSTPVPTDPTLSQAAVSVFQQMMTQAGFSNVSANVVNGVIVATGTWNGANNSPMNVPGMTVTKA